MAVENTSCKSRRACQHHQQPDGKAVKIFGSSCVAQLSEAVSESTSAQATDSKVAQSFAGQTMLPASATFKLGSVSTGLWLALRWDRLASVLLPWLAELHRSPIMLCWALGEEALPPHLNLYRLQTFQNKGSRSTTKAPQTMTRVRLEVGGRDKLDEIYFVQKANHPKRTRKI